MKFKQLLSLFNQEIPNKTSIISAFKNVAKTIAPKLPQGDSIALLSDVLDSELSLNSYKPTNVNELNIMTLHKSKGLEFDLVFHLDLHEWILPKKELKIPNDWNSIFHSNWNQDINLHYVGITRARKLCFLLSSTQRLNYQGVIKQGNDSEFLWLEGIDNLRYKKATK